jgi:hypothetical protein
MIGITFWEKNMMDSTFWVKKHDWQHILRKNIIESKLWGRGEILLIAHSGKAKPD